jgi:exodeoxyribonuclease VII large subunit
VAVQGHLAVEQVIGALQALDAVPEVDVIVLARGGGSVEDLLPFSDEALCRAVVRCRTPVVSAIGHEPDAPLVDLVADVRCSTPTDAGKRVVPDVQEESQKVRRALDRARRVVTHLVQAERAGLTALRSRPVLADPHVLLDRRRDDVGACRSGPAVHLRPARARPGRPRARPRPGGGAQPAGDAGPRLRGGAGRGGSGRPRRRRRAPGTDLQVRLAAGVLFVTAE